MPEEEDNDGFEKSTCSTCLDLGDLRNGRDWYERGDSIHQGTVGVADGGVWAVRNAHLGAVTDATRSIGRPYEPASWCSTNRTRRHLRVS